MAVDTDSAPDKLRIKIYVLAIREIIRKMYFHIKYTFLAQMCNNINHISHDVSRTASIGPFKPSQYKTISVNQAHAVQFPPSFARYHARDICIVSTSQVRAKKKKREKRGKKKRIPPLKWHVLNERNFLLFPGRLILQKHEADRGRDLHAHQLRDVEIRHRRLGHQLEWLPSRHHGRQGSE